MPTSSTPGASEAATETVYIGQIPDPEFPEDWGLCTNLHARFTPSSETAPAMWHVTIDNAATFTAYPKDLPGLVEFLATLPREEPAND